MKELYPHQQKIYLENPIRKGLWMEMRTGKSPLAIRLAAKNCQSCLVIVPKYLVEQWTEYIKDWDDVGIEWKVIGKERFRIDISKIGQFDGLIIDECHRQAANYKSAFYKAVCAYITRYSIKKLWLLSGTPYSNNSWSVYSLAILLGKALNWWEWRSRFFYLVRMGQRDIPVQKKGIEKDMAAILNEIGYTVKLGDIMSLPDDELIIEYFDLNAEQKKLIKDTFDPLPIVRFTKQHQIESGCLKGGDYAEDIVIDCEKTKRVFELVEENDKIAIVCRYNLQIAQYEKVISSWGRTVFVINGSTKNRADIVKEVDSIDKCVVLINSSCSDGYSLKSISVMVFASMSFSFVDYAQIMSRVKDMKKTTGNTYIYLLTRDKDSVDKGVYDSVKRKEDFNIEIFNKKI